MKVRLGKIPLVKKDTGEPFVFDAPSWKMPTMMEMYPHYEPAKIPEEPIIIDLPDDAIPLGFLEDYSKTWLDGSPCSGRWFKSLVYAVPVKEE